MSDSIHEFIDMLQSEVSVAYEIDAPSNPEGEWWIDLEIEGMRSNVLWTPTLGFGVFVDEGSYGSRPQEIYKKPPEASARILQLAAQWRKEAHLHPLGLRELRHLLGETQMSVAQNLSTDQARVSRVETAQDIKVSTLINYLRAMGGRLELRAHFPSFEASIEPVDPVSVKARQI